MKNNCDICGSDFSEGHYNWRGKPFFRAKELCMTCGSTIKSQLVNNIAIVGTCTNDVYSLQEMIEDGFDKKKSINSIKLIGEVIGLSKDQIKKKIKS